MASSSNKKLSILYVLRILEKYSDENHLLTQEDIVQKIYSIYGMECERKSVGASLDSLEALGYDIAKVPRRGCYLGERMFEDSEVSYLIDSLFSSKVIPSSMARTLAEKVASKLSIYQTKRFKYIYKADDISRSDNRQVFYTVDIINQAIEQGKKIRFKYNKYVQNNQMKERKEGKFYTVNPYFMVNSQGKYYLVCNYEHFDTLANYRIEFITEIEILEQGIKPITSLKGCEGGVDIAKYVNENIYMFGGEHIEATLKLENENAVSYVADWFGKNARFFQKDGELYAEAKTNEMALVYWALQYGESVEVIEPLQTREKIKEIISKMANKYRK